MKYEKLNQRVKQDGIALLELVIAVGIGALVLLGVSKAIDAWSVEDRAAVATAQLNIIGDAAVEYTKRNFGVIYGRTSATINEVIPVGTLIGAGYLTPETASKNTYNQDICVLAVRNNIAPNQLDLFVITENGMALNDLDLGNIVPKVTGGGGVYSTNAATARGAAGLWSYPVANLQRATFSGKRCDGTTVGNPAIGAGRMVVRRGSMVDPQQGLISRTDASKAKMLTNIGLDITQTKGAACATNGSVASNAAGDFLVCKANIWEKPESTNTWDEPVATVGDLPTCDTTNLGHVRSVTGVSFAFAAYMNKYPMYVCDGFVWSPIFIDTNGDVEYTTKITIAGNSAMSAWDWVQAYVRDGLPCPPEYRDGDVIRLFFNLGNSTYPYEYLQLIDDNAKMFSVCKGGVIKTIENQTNLHAYQLHYGGSPAITLMGYGTNNSGGGFTGEVWCRKAAGDSAAGCGDYGVVFCSTWNCVYDNAKFDPAYAYDPVTNPGRRVVVTNLSSIVPNPAILHVSVIW